MTLPIFILLLIFGSHNLLAQDNEIIEFKNAIELTGSASAFELRGINQLNGPYFNFKYKRSIFQDAMNNFSIGLLAHHSRFRLKTEYFTSGTSINLTLNSNHEVNSAGFLLNHRFTGDLKKIRLFMDLELCGLFELSAKQNTELREGLAGYFGGYAGYNNSIEYTILTEPILSEFVCYFSLSAGMELKVKGQRRFYYSIGLSRNINSLYQPTYISRFLPTLRDFFFFSGSLNVGYRF